MAYGIVDTRRSDELAYDNTLGAIDHKGTRCGHKGKVSHKNIVAYDLSAFLIIKPYIDLKWSRVSSVSVLTLLDRILHVILAELEIHKLETQMTVVVRDRRNVSKYFLQTFFQEPAVRILLHLDQIGYLQNLLLSGETHARILTGGNGTYPVFFHRRFTPF